MSKVRKNTTGDRLMIDELVANAKCGLRNTSEKANRDGVAQIADTADHYNHGVRP